MKRKTLVVYNRDLTPFLVRIVELGDRYGLNDGLVHRTDDPHEGGPDPLVEFYDLSQDTAKFGERGQFVSRYDFSTLVEAAPWTGLNLSGGVPGWSLDGPAMQMVGRFLKAFR